MGTQIMFILVALCFIDSQNKQAQIWAYRYGYVLIWLNNLQIWVCLLLIKIIQIWAHRYGYANKYVSVAIFIKNKKASCD